jgi:tripartite ATP-independent transporter DctP family solute receptor
MFIDRFLKTTALAGVMLAASLAGVQAKDWRGWGIHPDDYPNSVALVQFANDVTDKTGGAIKATVYNGGILGDQPDAIEQTRNGALDFGNFNLGPMGPIVPETNVLSLPFLFSSVDQMHKVMDGEIGKKFSDAMAQKGLVALSWYDSGARSFYNTKHPIEKPDDMKGLKMRVMNNDLYVQMVAKLGGNATPMAYGEVYQSLKTGVIDGAENNYPSYESSNHYEVAKYYSITDHLIIPECLCISKASWDALTPDQQKAVQQAATDSAKKQRELWAAREKESQKKVEAAGAKVNEVADKSAFQADMKPIYDKYMADNPQMADLIKAIQSTK